MYNYHQCLPTSNILLHTLLGRNFILLLPHSRLEGRGEYNWCKVSNTIAKYYYQIRTDITCDVSHYVIHTLGGIASICVRFHFQQTLRMHTQGCQGCQKTRNFVRNSKILIARSTIQPKWSKIKNNLPLFKEFWCISKCFFDFTQFWLNGRPGNYYFCISHTISDLLTPLTPLGVHPQHIRRFKKYFIMHLY